MPTTQTRPIHQKTQNTVRSRRKKNTRRAIPRYSGLVLEISTKILVNAIITTAALAGLNQLVSTYQTQSSRLEEVKQEVERTQARVDELKNEFTQTFDPYQSEIIMQEQTNQIKPNQRHVVWLEPDQ
ncbi:MAG: hypothetical protein BRC33_10150 [Cyanobacteria bacterium SW_9_44_58]|nr:MAG: hypothetical protein BRC33_10150 [Cyanobacteria bacterium SW_9_44_58]